MNPIHDLKFLIDETDFDFEGIMPLVWSHSYYFDQDPIGLLGGINLYQFSQNVQTWIDPLGLNEKLSEMAYSVHDLAGGLKTPDARAIEKYTR